MKEIEKKLKQFRDERNITLFPLSIKEDMLDEVREAREGLQRQDLNNYVEELADVAIFALNGLGLVNQPFNRLTMNLKEMKINKLEETINQINISLPIQTRQMLCIIITMCEALVSQKSYNFIGVLDEKVKLISSRRQCPKQKEEWKTAKIKNKWQKDPKQDKNSLYKPNYGKHRYSN